jgi:DNA polymerase III subunit delta'
MAFAEVLGHDRVKALLSQSLEQRRLPPALLLAGPDGVGKKTLALAAARTLLCEAGGGEACDRCATCRRVLRALATLPELRSRAEKERDPSLRNHVLHPDLVLVEPWPTGIKIEQIRDLVREVAGRPFEARARAFVIDDAHEMTEQASNALLKCLEEPPATSHVLLVSAAPQALLPTIRSRCQLLRLGPLTASLLEAYLRDRAGLPADEARLRAALSGGSLGTALTFASDDYRALRADLLTILEGIDRAGAVARMSAAEKLADVDDLPLALAALRSLLRDAAALRLGLPPERLLNADVADRLSGLAQGRLAESALALADAVGEAREALEGNANKLLTLDVLLDRFAADPAPSA